MTYRLMLFYIAATIVLTGCSMIPNQSVSKKYDASNDTVRSLFAQPYIDPLTHYIKRYSADAEKSTEVALVRKEREKRCKLVADNYAKEPLTEESLKRYTRGYQFSCPAEVDQFAKKVAELAESKSTNSDRVAADNANKKQLNDCYLLTKIRNFSDALQACRQPASQGDTKAQVNMAMMAYALKNYEEARYWATKAAPSSGIASNLVGEIYLQGDGVDVNLSMAKKWFENAIKQGFNDASVRLKQVDALLTEKAKN